MQLVLCQAAHQEAGSVWLSSHGPAGGPGPWGLSYEGFSFLLAVTQRLSQATLSHMGPSGVAAFFNKASKGQYLFFMKTSRMGVTVFSKVVTKVMSGTFTIFYWVQ